MVEHRVSWLDQVFVWLSRIGGLGLVFLAIALSRIYVGVHYPLDVIGGAALGAAVAIALRLLAGVPRRPLRAPRPG